MNDVFAAASYILRQPPLKNKYCSAFFAAAVIKKGGVVIFPTETVYGLGCNAFNTIAVETVFKLKKRPLFDPLIVHIADLSQLSDLSVNISSQVMRMAEKFWPGPLTLILPKTKNIPDIVTAGLKTVALRMPSHPVALKIIRASGCPVAAASANIFGALSPTTVENAKSQFGDSVPCVVDGGPCEIGVESSIVDLSGAKARLLRPGGIPRDLLKEALGELEFARNNSARPLCPGTMPRHYAPRTRMVLNTCLTSWKRQGRVGRVVFGRHRCDGSQCVENLSPSGDLNEAAKNLYAALARLDQKGLDIIVADILPARGLGEVINDRLRRASAKKGLDKEGSKR